MIDECVDHGCKGYGLGYATAWIKLPCDVAAIRKSYISGSRTHGANALAKQFSISASQVRRVVKGVHHVT